MKYLHKLQVLLIATALPATFQINAQNAIATASQAASVQSLYALNKSVEALPETSADQKLKKATLLWALEDAKACQEAGFTDRANVTLQDVQALLPQKIGIARTAPENLFPRKPEFQITTYPPAGSLERIGNKSDKTAMAYLLQGRYKKGPDGDVVQSPTEGWVAIKIAYEAEKLAMAICHPESPYAGNPKLIAPMFRRFENAYEYMVPENRKKRLADFGPTPALSQMYLLVKTVYPDLLLPSRQAAWEKAIRLNCEAILEIRETLFSEARPGTAYVNCDIKYISGLTYAGELFNDQRYKKVARSGIRLMETAIYPDGASAYISWQNEVFTYHGILVSELARIAQVTRNQFPLELVKRTANYYPLSFVNTWGTNGVGEFTTASSWKQNWNGMYPGEAAVLVEYYTGRTQSVPPSESYFVYDRNIEGPRGRFGGFAFCGTARDFHNDNRGKNTYVGCMALFSSDADLPPGFQPQNALSAALANVGTEVKPNPGAEGRASYSLSQNEHNATTVSRNFAALTTVHNLSPYGGNPTEWLGRQVWLFNSKRLVGLVCAESLKDQQACSIRGNLQFVTFKKDGQGIQTVGNDRFKTGLLNMKFHKHNYAEIKATTTPAKFTNIMLYDKADGAGGDELISYTKGTKHFYLVEVYPDSSIPAETVSLLALDAGLTGFMVTEDGRSYHVIFNPTEAEVVYKCGTDDVGRLLHRSGEQFRPAWIGNGKEELINAPQSLIPLSKNAKVAIPAGSHIVLIN